MSEKGQTTDPSGWPLRYGRDRRIRSTVRGWVVMVEPTKGFYEQLYQAQGHQLLQGGVSADVAVPIVMTSRDEAKAEAASLRESYGGAEDYECRVTIRRCRVDLVIEPSRKRKRYR